MEKNELKVIVYFVLAGFTLVVLDILVDSIFFTEGNLLDIFIGTVLTMELTLPFSIIIVFFLFGVFTAKELSKRRKIETKNLEHISKLEIISRCSGSFNETLEISIILHRLVESAMELTNVSYGTAGLLVNNKIVFSEYHDNGQIIPVHVEFEEEQGVPGYVKKSMKPYMTNDALNDPLVIPEIQKKLGFLALVNVPIINSIGEYIGCIELHNKEDKSFFENFDIELLRGLVSNAAVAINNAKNLEKVKLAKVTLRESEERFRHLMHQSPTTIEIYDKNGLQIDVNEAYEKLWGFPAETTLNKFNLFKSKEIEEKGLLEYAERAYNGDVVYLPEYKFDPTKSAEIKGAGRPRWLKTKIYPLKDKEGNISNIVITHEDISGIKFAEEDVKESEKKYRELFDEALNLIHIVSPEGNIIDVNQAEIDRLGYTKEELLDKKILDIIAPEFHDKVNDNFKELHEGDPLKNAELAMLTKKGERIFVEANVTPQLVNGKIVAFRTILSDLTQRKKAEEVVLSQLAFRNNIEKFHRASQNTKDLDTLMSDILETALEVFNCDRAWLIFPCNPDAESWYVPMERTKMGYTGAAEIGVEIPMLPEAQDIFRLALGSDDPVTFDPISKNSQPIALAEKFNIKSQIITAIHPRKGDSWLLGLHQCSAARIWTSEDVKLFKEFGRMIADSLSSLIFLRDLQMSEKKYSSVVETGTDGIIIHQEGIIKFANSAIKNQTGYEADELLEKNILDAINPEFREMILKNYSDRVAGKKLPNIYEIDLLKKDGSKLPVEISASIIEYLDKPSVLVFVRDISRRKIAENELNSARLFSDNLIQTANAMIVGIDLNGNVQMMNPAAELITGYKFEELHKKNWFETLLPKDKYQSVWNKYQGAWNEYQKQTRKSVPKILLLPILTKKGDERIISLSNSELIKDDKIVGTISFGIDVTEQKKSKEALVRSEEFLKTTGKVAKVGGWELDVETREVRWTEETYRIHDIPVGTIININDGIKLYHTDDQPKLESALKDAIENGNSYDIEVRFIKPEGEMVWLRKILEPQVINGKIVKLFGTIQDITERKGKEIQILKLSKAIEQSPTTIVITDINGNIDYVNRRFEETTGYTKEEIFGKNPRILKSGNVSKENYTELWDTITTGKTWRGEFHNKKKNGELYWEDAIISPVMNEENKIFNFLAIKTDITEMKLLQWKLEQYNFELEKRVAERTEQFTISEGNYRILAESMDEYICRIDKDHNITYINSSLLKTLEKDLSDFIGKNLIESVKLFGEEKVSEIIEIILREKKSNKLIGQVPWGKWIEWHIIFENNLTSDNGNIIIVGHDITERKQIEIKMKKALGKEKELNELKSQFISTVSHEFRTPLTSIYSSIELIERYGYKWDNDKKVDHYTRIKKSIDHLTKMLEEILQLNHTESGRLNFQPVLIDLNKFCNTVLNDLKPLLLKEHMLNYNFGLPDKNYSIDPNILRVILTNLISNAIKYSPKGGNIDLDISPENNNIQFTIKDEGMGISKEDMGKLFVPFYRTDDASTIPGSGLGLSIAKNYIELHNGRLKVESFLGKGSTFSLLLPKILNN
jgi:PAS domain S-box-containing protein